MVLHEHPLSLTGKPFSLLRMTQVLWLFTETARSLCDGPVTVTGAGAVSKSYPAFFDDYASLKGESHEI